MTTRQQQMALSAYDRVTAVEGQRPDYRQKYGTMAHKLPLLIHTAGLAQALAFVESRDKDPHMQPHTQLLQHLAETVDHAGIHHGRDLAARSRAAELDEYMLLTRRVLAALVWYKRFVESILKIEQPDTAEGGKI